jgi:hypothetical protein
MTDIEEYLDALPAERQTAMRAMRDIIRQNLPAGYEEVMNWGMIAYQVPLADFPQTYNGQPLLYAALASQKNYMSLYLNSIYSDEQHRQKFENDFRESGKKLNAGKSCVRFKRLEDLPLEVIARVIASTPPEDFIQMYRNARGKNKSK